MAAAPTRKHFWAHKRLKDRFEETVEDTGWGYVYTPVEVQLGGPTAVEPDRFVLRKDRLDLFAEAAVVGVPDIVVEVQSPLTRVVDLQIKRRRYEQAGVPEYWIADPEQETLTVLALVDGRYTEIAHQHGRVASTVVPGLVVDIAPLFAPAG